MPVLISYNEANPVPNINNWHDRLSPMPSPSMHPEDFDRQTQSEYGGAGRPPRPTAIGVEDAEPSPQSLTWWQRLLARFMGFLLGANTSAHDHED